MVVVAGRTATSPVVAASRAGPGPHGGGVDGGPMNTQAGPGPARIRRGRGDGDSVTEGGDSGDDDDSGAPARAAAGGTTQERLRRLRRRERRRAGGGLLRRGDSGAGSLLSQLWSELGARPHPADRT